MNEPQTKRSLQHFYARALVRERTRAGLTQDELGARPEVMFSGKLIGHIENCRRAPSLRLSRGLDRTFSLEEYFEELYEHIVLESGIPQVFWEYTEQEGQADSIRSYNNFLISGLLQHEDYARAILSAGRPADRVDELVTARLARQEILRRERPPWLFAVLDEFVLRRPVGGPDVMRHQLAHLLTMAREPRVTIVVVPCTAPVYPSAPFTLLGFADRSALAYAESARGHGRVIERAPQVAEFGVLFDRVASVALPVADSEELIRAVLEDT